MKIASLTQLLQAANQRILEGSEPVSNAASKTAISCDNHVKAIPEDGVALTPDSRYDNAEWQIFLQLHEQWKTRSRLARPVKTLMDAERSLEDYRVFSKQKNTGLFRRSTLLRFRDELSQTRQLHPKTIAKRPTFLRSILAIAVDEERLSANPASDINMPRDRNPEPARHPFTIHMLNRLFSTPVYTHGHRPLGRAGEAAYWIPLIALFSGMRLEEIAQLQVGHCGEVEGILCFSVTSVDGGSLKTLSSQRQIPVHAEWDPSV